MNCSGFLASFSQVLDGCADVETVREAKIHRAHCQRCRRYAETLEEGLAVLQSLPAPDVSPDFRRTLDYRLLYLEEGRSGHNVLSVSQESGTTFSMVLILAFLAAFSAWAPLLGTGPAVPEGASPVASPQPPPSVPARVQPTFSQTPSVFTTTRFEEGMWADSHDLLREYSPIMERRNASAAFGAGIE